MTDRELMQQALEKLEFFSHMKSVSEDTMRLITDLRERLAQPVREQEPVAWLAPRTVDSYMRPDLGYETCSKTDYAAFPVYTAPTPRKPLTDEQFNRIPELYVIPPHHVEMVVRAIEATHGIKEKP